MGSAICNPLVKAGWDVHLWGTWLDDHLIDAIDAGEPHPRTGAIISPQVTTYRSADLEKALEGAHVVILAVASVGVPKITEMALNGMSAAESVWLTSKGFNPDSEGTIELLPTTLRRISSNAGKSLPHIVAVAGPVKANECANGEPTATIFGCRDLSVAQKYAQQASTEHYRIEVTDDEAGVEICAPMKNVYAISLGIADGLEEASGNPHHNLKAATFTQAVKEMSVLGQAMGAKPETAFGLAGVGDLEVTGLSGRNKVYGLRLGRGEAPDDALAEMERMEQTVEGVPAARYAKELVKQLEITEEQVPLFFAIDRILAGGIEDVKEEIARAVLPRP